MTGLPCLGLEICPPRFGRHPENILGKVFVAVFGGVFAPFFNNRCAAFLEGVGDILQEDEAEHDVLVLSGIHGAAERIGHLPEFRLVADGRAAVVFFDHFVSGRSYVGEPFR